MPQTNQITDATKTIASNEDQLVKVLENFQSTITDLHDLRKSISKLSKEDMKLLPDTRTLKVHTHLRTHGKNPTTACPEIILRGNWLEKAGINCNDQWVHIITTNDMIVITPAIK